jgi:hypothetical protein
MELSVDRKNYIELSHKGKNKKIIEIFPEDFYENLGVKIGDVLPYADLIIDGGSTLLNAIYEEKEDWVIKNARKIREEIEAATMTGGRLRFDSSYAENEASLIFNEEVIFGLKLLNSMPADKKKEILSLLDSRKKISPRDSDDKVFGVWAGGVIMRLLDMADIYKTEIRPPLIHHFIARDGLLVALYWIRKFVDDSKVPIWADVFRETLIAVIKSNG